MIKKLIVQTMKMMILIQVSLMTSMTKNQNQIITKIKSLHKLTNLSVAMKKV